MSAIFIVVILLAGFIYSELNSKTKYRLIKSTGWHTYFLAGKFGIYFSLLAGLLTSPLHLFLQNDKLNIWVVAWAVLTVLLAIIWGKYHYLFLRLCQPLCTRYARLVVLRAVSKQKIRSIWRKAKIWKNEYEANSAQESAYLIATSNQFEYMLYEATKSVRMLQITLKSNKVYIGYIQNTLINDNFDDTEYFTIYPLISGYRNKDDLTLTLTTSYADAYKQINNMSEASDKLEEKFKILIPRSEVSTMGYFNPEYYGKFNNGEANNNL